MSLYRATLDNGIKKFSYNGVEYSSGGQFESDSACEMLGFAKAYQDQNPEGGKGDITPNFWSNMQAACPGGNGGNPVPAPNSPPVEDNPTNAGGDSADNQGAPKPVSQGPAGAEISQPGDQPGDPAPGDEPKRPPTGEPDATLNNEQPQQQTNAGDPVDIFSGSFYLQETDLEVPNTILPLAFTRTYRSGIAVYGPLGWNWDHNYNLYLRELNDGNIALWRNLHEDIYRFDGANFEPPRGVFEKLERVPGLAQVYEIVSEGGNRMHFEHPAGWVDGERIPLTNIEDRHGNALRFTYGAEDRLVEVRDDDDRYFHIDYDLCGLLVAVSDHTGRAYLYAHDEQTFHVVGVTSPATVDHPDGITKTYYYADPFAPVALRHNIVRVEDSAGMVYLENTYEEDPSSWSFARLTEQLYGGYFFQFQYTQLQYVPTDVLYINIPAERVEVMNPDYGLETYTFNYRGDLLDRRFRLCRDQSFRVVAIQYEFDEQGNLAVTTKPDGSQERNVYDATNPDPRMRGKLLLRELIAAAGFPVPSRIVWRGTYEPMYQLLFEEKNEVNAVTRYRYDFDVTPAAPTNTGKLKEIIHPDAHLPDGSVQTATTHFEHNAKGQVTAIVLPDDARQEMVYGVAGEAASRLVTQVYDTANLAIVNYVAYNAYGFDADTIDGNGYLTRKSINALGQMEGETLPAVNGLSTDYILHYDVDRRVVGLERPRGAYVDAAFVGSYIVDQFERDVLGYPIKYQLSTNTSEPKTVLVCSDFRGFPIEVINPDGSRIEHTYDERGLPISEAINGADGTRSSRRKAYDRSGNLTHDFDEGGLATEYEYDGFGRMAKIILPNGSVVTNRWQKGDVLEQVEISGDDGIGNRRLLSKTAYSYDEKFRKITATIQSFTDNPAAAVAITNTFYYDNMDRIDRIIDHRGGVQSFQYDGLGRLTAHADALHNEEHVSYDNNGNTIQLDEHHVEPDGSVSVLSKRFAYDERNRQTQIIEPDGASITFEYDDRDLAIRQIDYLGRVKSIAYNALGNRTSETYDVGGLAISHNWKLDEMSRSIAYIDPTGQVSHYQLDGIGRVVRTDYPNGFSSTRSFNAQGLCVSEQIASGTFFEYSYDAAHRLAKVRNTVAPALLNAVPDHDITYDGLDRLVSAVNGASTVVRKYDSLGRLVSEQTLGASLNCSFNDLAGVMDKTWPDGRCERVSHDLNGTVSKIEEIVNGRLGSGGNLIASLLPSGDDYLGELSGQGNLLIAAKYDQRKRPVELAITSPGGISEYAHYCYDRANRKRVEAYTGQNPVTNYYEFDTKYRLALSRDGFAAAVPVANTQGDHDNAINAVRAASVGAVREEIYRYDSADARLQHSQTGDPVANYTYLTGHRVQNDGACNYLYAPDGVLRTDGQFSYDADALGRVVAIKSGASVVCTIVYDALGRPSIVAEAGKPQRTFNYLGAYVEQENENGDAVRQKTLHPATGIPIAYHTNGATFYTLFDGRFNLVGLANTNGDLLESYRYQPFGLPHVFDAAGASIPASQFDIEPVFGGQIYLSSSGLYLAKRRLMNPTHGMFLSPDPKGYANSASLYVYAAQNPIDLVDPDGEFAFLAILAIMAFGTLVSGGFNAARQGIQMAEDPRRRKAGFSWGELGMSMGFGAVAAPVLVVAPELAAPLAAYGVYGGIEQWREGNGWTGTFDIVTSLAPFWFKGVHNASFGRGSAIGQALGLGPMASRSVRLNRFTLIEKNFANFLPSPFGRRVGLGFAPFRGGPEGHTAIIIEKEGGGFWFAEKNWGNDEGTIAGFNELQEPPKHYFSERRPFEFESMKVSRSANKEAMSYAKDRMFWHLIEPFDRDCMNCSHFAADVLGKAGFKGMGNGKASGLYSDFTNFNRATNMSYASPFWARLLNGSTLSK